jgi:hypothetical protein
MIKINLTHCDAKGLSDCINIEVYAIHFVSHESIYYYVF